MNPTGICPHCGHITTLHPDARTRGWLCLDCLVADVTAEAERAELAAPPICPDCLVGGGRHMASCHLA